MKNYKNHIVGFMTFYQKFQFEDEMVSVYYGKSIRKTDYLNMEVPIL